MAVWSMPRKGEAAPLACQAIFTNPGRECQEFEGVTFGVTELEGRNAAGVGRQGLRTAFR